MSLGDDCSKLARCVRNLKKEGRLPVHEKKLQETLKWEADRFHEAVIDASNRSILSKSPDGMINEGTMLTTQPDPEEARKLSRRYQVDWRSQPVWERVWLAFLATGLVIFVGYLIMEKSDFKDRPWKLAVVLASLMAAAVGAFVSGMLTVDYKRPGLEVRAIGALAAFVLVLVLLVWS